MEAHRMNHPAPEVLRALVAGQLDSAAADAAFTHLESCTACRETAAALSGDSFLRRLRAARPPGSTTAVARGAGDTQRSEAGTPTVTHVPSDLPPELRDHPQYEVVRELGRGGMGVAYLARNKLMDRPEVLKVVGKHLLDSPCAAERFQREIRSAAKLSQPSHPNIVTAHAAFQAGDLLVFAMEFVEGETLAQVVKARGPLPVVNACYYAQQVAKGLQHACDCEMVHRDIKPQNLILARQGKKHTVKILDFGLAKAAQERGQDDHSLTGTRAMLGTPDYIAPEQAQDAAAADIRADIYSLGCTLYFLLSGAPPFQDKSVSEIVRAHRSKEAARLDQVRADVPALLAAVVAKMMAKDPAGRYQKPAEVVQALAPFVRSSPGPVEPGPDVPADTVLEARKLTLVLRLGAAGLLGAVVLGAVFLLNREPKAESASGSGQGTRQENGHQKNGAADQGAGGGGSPWAAGKVPANLRTTVGFVDYEVAGSRMDGRVWEFTVKATSRKGRQGFYFRDLEVRTDEGKTYEAPSGSLMPSFQRPAEGEPVLIKMTMSKLPAGVKKLARVKLDGPGGGQPPVESVIFVDVPVEPEREQGAGPRQPAAEGPGAGKPAPAGQDGKVGSPMPKKVPANLRTTANNVDYEVIGSRMNGRVWELTLKVTARRGRSLLLWGLQVTTEDGKEFRLPPGKVMEQKVLTVGAPIKIETTLSTLPPGVKKLSRVVLVEHQSAFGQGAEPVVFLDVPIEPDPEAAGSPPGDRKK